MKCLTTKLEKKPASSQIFGDGEDLLVGTYQLNSDTNSGKNLNFFENFY